MPIRTTSPKYYNKTRNKVIVVDDSLTAHSDALTRHSEKLAKNSEEIEALKIQVNYMKFLQSGETKLDNIPWEQIDAIAQMGKAAEIFSLGDEKNITLLTGEVRTFRIVAFEHDDLVAGGKAKITFDMKNLYTVNSPYNSDNHVNWETCSFRNKDLPQIRKNLPSDLISVIKPVNKVTYNIHKEALVTTTEDIFVPTETELYGAQTHSAEGEGTQYEHYVDKAYDYFKKYDGNGEGGIKNWYLRSPVKVNNIGNICCVNALGKPTWNECYKVGFWCLYFCI